MSSCSVPLQQGGGFGRSGGGGGGHWHSPRCPPRPTPRVVQALRERAEQYDPQIQQRRQRLQDGHHHYYVTCHPGLEAVVAAELEASTIGAANVHPGGQWGMGREGLGVEGMALAMVELSAADLC